MLDQSRREGTIQQETFISATKPCHYVSQLMHVQGSWFVAQVPWLKPFEFATWKNPWFEKFKMKFAKSHFCSANLIWVHEILDLFFQSRFDLLFWKIKTENNLVSVVLEINDYKKWNSSIFWHLLVVVYPLKIFQNVSRMKECSPTDLNLPRKDILTFTDSTVKDPYRKTFLSMGVLNDQKWSDLFNSRITSSILFIRYEHYRFRYQLNLA